MLSSSSISEKRENPNTFSSYIMKIIRSLSYYYEWWIYIYFPVFVENLKSGYVTGRKIKENFVRKQMVSLKMRQRSVALLQPLKMRFGEIKVSVFRGWLLHLSYIKGDHGNLSLKWRHQICSTAHSRCMKMRVPELELFAAKNVISCTASFTFSGRDVLNHHLISDWLVSIFNRCVTPCFWFVEESNFHRSQRSDRSSSQFLDFIQFPSSCMHTRFHPDILKYFEHLRLIEA